MRRDHVPWWRDFNEDQTLNVLIFVFAVIAGTIMAIFDYFNGRAG